MIDDFKLTVYNQTDWYFIKYTSISKYGEIKMDWEKRITNIENKIKSLESTFFSGIGFDSHKFCDSSNDLILGNIKIPFEKGLYSHSDGDVLIHAIIDALLGGAGLKDIGTHFPDTDNQLKNADSSKFLKDVILILKKENLMIQNVDTVIITQFPKISPYTDKIKERLSEIMNVPKNKIGIKSKTAEGMGFIGEGKGIAVFAVATLKKFN